MIIRKKKVPFTGKFQFKVYSVDPITDTEKLDVVFLTLAQAKNYIKQKLK